MNPLRISLTTCGLGALVALAAFSSDTSVAPSSADHEQAIADTYRDWLDATNDKDIDRWGSFLAPNAVFLPPDNPRLETEEAILAFYSELFRDENFSLDCQQELIEVAVAEDMAWSSGHCRATFTGPDGQVARGRSKWAKVWKRMPDRGWKCVMNSWSSTGPQVS